MSLGRTASTLSAFYRRLAVCIGKAKAITAAARNLALPGARQTLDLARYGFRSLWRKPSLRRTVEWRG
jgi:hypothetical protein